MLYFLCFVLYICCMISAIFLLLTIPTTADRAALDCPVRACAFLSLALTVYLRAQGGTVLYLPDVPVTFVTSVLSRYVCAVILLLHVVLQNSIGIPSAFFLGGRRGTRAPKHLVNLTGESKKKINVGIPAKPTPNVLWIFMWFVKFYI
jgi:hypothetical protein